MAEMKISNTLVNDTSTGVIAFAKQIKDELINWAEYNHVTKDWTDTDKQNNRMQGKLNALFLSIGDKFFTFLQDEDITDNTVNTWKEIENFLAGYTDDATLASIVAQLNANIESRLTVEITQELGNAKDKVISQKVVSDNIIALRDRLVVLSEKEFELLEEKDADKFYFIYEEES